jgi:hypothetical protein
MDISYSHPCHVTQSGEVVLPNVSQKRHLIHQRICFIGTATAGAATIGATTLPNASSHIRMGSNDDQSIQ